MDNQFPDSPFTPTGAAPSAPPPPSEVKVRTMRSDLDAMAKSGGGLPRFESVKMEHLSIRKAAPALNAAASEPSAAAPPAATSTRGLMALLAVVAVLAILGAGAFFAYRVYLGGSSGFAWPWAQTPSRSAASGQSGGTVAAKTPATTPAAPPSATSFMHKSFFKKPADQTLTLMLSSGDSASSATDLMTFNQKLAAVLARAGKTSTIVEVLMRKADGSGIAASDFLAQADIPLLDPTLLAAHFDPDETFFAYQDKSGGWWPGLVLSLKPGENWLFVKDAVAKLESSPAAIGNFFLANAGTPSPDGFTDSMVSNAPVRVLSFLTPQSAAYFTYGWDKTYLILATSQKGFAEAMARL